MKRLLKEYRLHENTEALFLLTLGIMIQVLDGSPLDMKYRWTLAWETEFPREQFSVLSQKIVKAVLSIIIIARCLTSIFYVVFGLIVIYCIIYETAPNLILPWLVISGVKSVFLTLLETLTGVYVCSTFGKVRKPCVEFLMSKAVELFFAIYLWACIRSIHKDLEQFEESVREENFLTQMVIHRVNVKRRRARSLIDETTLYKTANLNYFELKDVPHIIVEMLKTEEELSQDSLISPGMMLSSVSNMGSYDYLKTSTSLGELGFIDLDAFQVVGLDDDRNSSPKDKAMKFLKITKDDIKAAKEITRRASFALNYEVPDEVPEGLANVKPFAFLNRQTRQQEVFFTDIPNMDNVREEELRKKRRTLLEKEEFMRHSREFEEKVERRISLDPSLASEDEFKAFDNKSHVSNEEEEESAPNLWFMTNIKDKVSRIRLIEPNPRPTDNYERLCNDERMMHVGPEVFDKESKLVKVTSLSDIYKKVDKFPSGIERIPSDEGESALPEDVPSTSRGTGGKKKKLGFHLVNHTAMPLSIIVTNYPVRMDTNVARSDTIIFRHSPSNSAEIMLLPESPRCSSFEISEHSLERVRNGNTEDAQILENLVTSETVPESSLETTAVASSFSYLPSYRNCGFGFGKLDFFLLCNHDRSQDFESSFFEYRSNMEPYPKEITQRNYAVYNNYGEKAKMPMMPAARINSALREDLYGFIQELEDGGLETMYEAPKWSEQMLFIKELMNKPIKDVLKAYYVLKELDNQMKLGNRYSRRVNSRDSFPARASLPQERQYDLDMYGSSILASMDYNMFYPSTGKPSISSVVEAESLYEEVQEETSNDNSKTNSAAKIPTETIRMGSPKTQKLKTKGNNVLAPLYLFGNDELGWSSSPLDLTTDESYGTASENPSRESNMSKKRVKSKSKKTSSRVESKTVNSAVQTESRSMEKKEVTSAKPKPKKLVAQSVPKISQKKSSYSTGSVIPKLALYSRAVMLSPQQSSHKLTKNNTATESLLSPQQSSHKLTKNNAATESFCSAKDNVLSQLSSDAAPVPLENPSTSSVDSDESFSLFYSKNADLASPLLDMRRFIYPDHIHYSYKNVKKKGFDVELNGGLPLLVRDSLTLNSSMTVKRVDTPPDPQTGITRRPMDLTFAHSEAFKSAPSASCSKDEDRELTMRKKSNESTDSYDESDFDLERVSSVNIFGPGCTFKKEELELKGFETEGARGQDTLEFASSTQLHSNKGRDGVIHNPVTFLENSRLQNKKLKRTRLKNFGNF